MPQPKLLLETWKAEEKFQQVSERKAKKEKLTGPIELLTANLAETKAALKVRQLAIDTRCLDEDKDLAQFTETEAALMQQIKDLEKEIAGKLIQFNISLYIWEIMKLMP